ncbi:hypothetical protein LL946_18250 [Knoellia locipacati]|uniref:hypothetical protein n=1 Tax=Knoellia locipacati TaxID=882824 RepID=UPI00384DBF96
MNDRDIDAEFDAIVAHWDDGAASSTPPAPRTVQDITAAYAALSRPEVDSPAPVDEPAADAAPDSHAGADATTDSPVDRTSEQVPDTTRDRVQDVAPPIAQEPVREVVVPLPVHRDEPEDQAGSAPEAWRQGHSTDEEDEHFEPPPVQLPPGEDIGYWGALLGLVGGPLVLLWVVLSKPFYAGWWTLGAILMFFGGFALMVLRQPRDRDPFDDDNGARV